MPREGRSAGGGPYLVRVAGPLSSVDVIVVGAGVAGLVATAALHEAGVDVVCLEGRDRVGGRTLSAHGWLDLGATWFWDGEEAVSKMVASLGLTAYPQPVAGDALYEQPGGATVRLDGNPVDVPAWRLVGGMQSVALELARRLPPGVVRTGALVGSVSFGAGGAVEVETGTGPVTGRVAVLAVPPRVVAGGIRFRPAVPPELLALAGAVPTWMGDTVKAVAVFEEPFWRRAGLAGAAFSHAGPYSEFHDHSGPQPGQAALFGFAPASVFAGGPEGAVAEQFVDQLARLWGPEARRPSGVHVVDWSREPFTGSAASTGGSARDLYGHPVLGAAHMDGRLMLASTETAPASAGHVEGAVLAGRRAAALALRTVAAGRRRP